MTNTYKSSFINGEIYMSMVKKLFPVINGSGYEEAGKSIWSSAVIKDEHGRYCMYASRCSDFFENHMDNAGIVLAVTEELDAPFVFEKVIIPNGHNPSIIKADGKYLLYYSGNDGDIYCAVSDTSSGDFEIPSEPIALPFKAYNPSVITDNHGNIRLFVRDENKKVFIFEAPSYNGKYTAIRENIFHLGKIEDICVHRVNFGYNMIALDTEGMYGGLKNAGSIFRSSDGLYWHPGSPVLAYDFSVSYTDGSVLNVDRREHPFIFIEDGVKYLFTAVQSGERVWNMVQKLGL